MVLNDGLSIYKMIGMVPPTQPRSTDELSLSTGANVGVIWRHVYLPKYFPKDINEIPTIIFSIKS